MEIRELNGANGIGEKVLHNLLVRIESQWHPELIGQEDALLEYSHKIYDKSSIIGVIVNDEIVGLASVYINDHETKQAYLTYIALLESYTHMGFGAELLSHVIKLAMDECMKSIKLEVKKTNYRARAFYKKFGFSELCDASENSVFMIRYLKEK